MYDSMTWLLLTALVVYGIGVLVVTAIGVAVQRVRGQRKLASVTQLHSSPSAGRRGHQQAA